MRFFRSVLTEIKRISWAGKREVAGFTAVVLVLVFVISFFVLFVDFVVSNIVGIFI
ncbi:MAG: preprotein translocase subunit SecE [Elusimicrobia bacterium]|nr:preprotein translocase subunit SecE [Elusimicrobiota bacterium]